MSSLATPSPRSQAEGFLLSPVPRSDQEHSITHRKRRVTPLQERESPKKILLIAEKDTRYPLIPNPLYRPPLARHVILPVDLRKEPGKSLSRPISDILEGIFPGLREIRENGFFISIYVDPLPPKPWPKTVGGLPLYLAPCQGPDHTPMPKTWGLPSLIPRSNAIIAESINGRDMPRGEWDPLFHAVRDHFCAVGVSITEVIYWGNHLMIVLQYRDTDKSKLPSLAGKIQCRYLYEDEMGRPSQMLSRRMMDPTPGDPDNTQYEHLQPGMRVSSDYKLDHQSFHTTTTGVLIQNSTGERFMTVASQGFPDECGTRVMHALPAGGRQIGELIMEVSHTDISLVKLQESETFRNTTFQTDVQEPVSLKSLTGKGGLKEYDIVYMDAPDTGLIEASRMAPSFVRIPVDDLLEPKQEWLQTTWFYLGQEGMEHALPAGIRGSAIWTADGRVAGFFRYAPQTGAMKNYCTGISSDELIDRGYSLVQTDDTGLPASRHGRAAAARAMGSFTSLLVAYLLGGVTFVPLLLVAAFAHGYYCLPYRHPADPERDFGAQDIVQPGDDTTPLDAANKSGKHDPKARPNNDLDVAAGFFAVCREYTPMGINAKPIERSTPVGSATVASPSPSVYQTMYRSIFERKPVAGPMDNGTNTSQRPKKAGNVFYVVLRHGHLMLFDDEEQVEVRHVISLAHHQISIYSGGGKPPEGELFIKRNALCLSRRRSSPEITPDTQVSKPFYLFSENCSAKEDFYFALLKNQKQTFGASNKAPTPLHFDVKSIISLVQKLHSTEDNLHSRWLNALLGRVFLGVYKTRDLENFIREKLTKKISRVKRPSFLTNIAIQRIDTGEAAPYFTNLKLRDLTVEGECVVEADVKYTGNCRIEVAATAKIDLGTRFKAREVNLVLAVVLKRAEGHVLFKIKPPPSNRVWLAFQTMPKMEMAIEPIVSSRQITYTLILRQIENRIKEVIAETIVLPFWDDMPFFKTDHKIWRGGIFDGDEATVRSEDAETTLAQAGDVSTVHRMEESSDVASETRPMEKSYTVPIMESPPLEQGLSGRGLGKSMADSVASGSSTSVDSRGPNFNPPRSPQIAKTTTEPVVATDAAHANIFKPSSSPPDHATKYMVALHSRSQDASQQAPPDGSPTKPSSLAQRPSRSTSPSKNGAASDGSGATDATHTAQGRRGTASSADSGSYSDDKGSVSDAASTKDSIKSNTGSIGRNFFLRRENSDISVATNSDTSQKRNTIAAVANAAAQARQWGWNAIQKQREARRHGDHGGDVDLSQPMGRGQPLPPPGTPLPGPTNGTTKISPIPVPTRKPVPPPPLPHRASAESLESHSEHRPVPAPPLPYRRRRGQSHQQDDNGDQNIFVVAAPDDSQPNTPATEDPGYMRPWVEEASDQTAVESGDLRDHSRTTHPASMGVEHLLGTDSPVEAIPVSSAADDDDDFSGWMDNDPIEETITKDTLSGRLSQEVK
ncbi:hypothetical protein G7046_g235 [Stylonectria norvegica]|nr:hypothetical protein G7046_g235 [Stylonectria norvegica]